MRKVYSIVDYKQLLVTTLYTMCVLFLLHPGRFSVLHYKTPTRQEMEIYRLKYTGRRKSFAFGTNISKIRNLKVQRNVLHFVY